MQTQTLSRRPATLTKNRLPRYAVWAVLGAAVILGAALSALIGFGIASFAVFTAVVFVATATAVTGVVEGAAVPWTALPLTWSADRSCWRWFRSFQ